MNFSKGFVKTAIIGPVIDIGNLGIPSLVGYSLGKSEALASRDKTEKNAPSSASKAIKYLMVPGYTGYRRGIAAGHEHNKNKSK